MGFFKNLGESLFGHGERWAGGTQERELGNWRNYMDAMNARFSPEAVRADTADYAGSLDRNIANQQGFSGLSYGRRGMRATPNYGYRRASGIAGFRANAEQNARAGRAQMYQTGAQMLAGMRPLFHQNATGGLMGSIGGALGGVGQALGMANRLRGKNQQPEQWDGQSPYGEATATPEGAISPSVWDSLSPQDQQTILAFFGGGMG